MVRQPFVLFSPSAREMSAGCSEQLLWSSIITSSFGSTISDLSETWQAAVVVIAHEECVLYFVSIPKNLPLWLQQGKIKTDVICVKEQPFKSFTLMRWKHRRGT